MGGAGGIPLQLQDGAGGYLVDSVEACAERTLWLLQHRGEARALGEQGRAVVRNRFLLTRLIADELRLYTSLLQSPQATHGDGTANGVVRRTRRPVDSRR